MAAPLIAADEKRAVTEDGEADRQPVESADVQRFADVIDKALRSGSNLTDVMSRWGTMPNYSPRPVLPVPALWRLRSNSVIF